MAQHHGTAAAHGQHHGTAAAYGQTCYQARLVFRHLPWDCNHMLVCQALLELIPGLVSLQLMALISFLQVVGQTIRIHCRYTWHVLI
jgi:hypothetical protein